MHKLKKILVLAFALFMFPQAVYANENEPLPLESEFSILIDANTGHVLHEVNMHGRAYPASITKVMTALLLLESGHDMATPIVHSHQAIATVMPWHSGLAYVDEYLTVEEALYAIMLDSANDTSNAIAEFLGTNMENFARMMTIRAHQLGATNTNFTNSHGLWEEDHFTTAYDITLIMREALRHEKFREVIATQRFAMPPIEDEQEYNPIYNTNRALFPTSQHFNPDIVGGKTGFTNNSRHTLVSYGERGDMELITVILSAEHRDGIYNDTKALMDFGFGQFTRHTAFSAHDFTRTVDLVQRSAEGVLIIGNIDVYAENDVVLSLPNDFNVQNITTEVFLPNRVAAPVARDFVVGRVSLMYEGDVLAEIPLLAAQNGPQLNVQELSALFPCMATGFIDYFANDYYDNLPITNLIVNVSIAAAGTLVFGLMILRFLRFSSARRKRVIRRHQRYRGYGSAATYKPSASDLKFKYRYK